MCSLLGSILHTATQLEKHPFTPPQPPKLNKENGSVRSEASLPWKELSVENVSGKKPNSLNRSRHIFQLNSDRWQKEFFFFLKPITRFGLYMLV